MLKEVEDRGRRTEDGERRTEDRYQILDFGFRISEKPSREKEGMEERKELVIRAIKSSHPLQHSPFRIQRSASAFCTGPGTNDDVSPPKRWISRTMDAVRNVCASLDIRKTV